MIRVFRLPLAALCGIAGLATVQAPSSSAVGAPPPPAQAKPAADPTTAALGKAAALRKEGKPEEALEVLRGATREVKQRRGVGHPDLLPIYDAAGEILVETDPREKAESLYEKSIAIREKMRAAGKLDDEGQLGRTWFLLGQVRLDAGKLEPARVAAETAIRLLDASRSPAHEETAAAWRLLERVASETEDLLGTDEPASRQARDTLSTMSESYGRYDLAIESRRKRAAALAKQSSGGGPDLAAERLRVQRLLLESGRAAEALSDQQALVEKLAADTSQAAASIEALRMLGDLQLATEHFTAATDARDRALAASESLHGKNHPEARLDRLGLLAIQTRRGRAADAAAVGEALAGPEEKDSPPALVESLANAAAILLETGDGDGALTFAKQAIAAETEWKAMPAAVRAEHRLLLARCHLALGNAAAARGVLDEALRESTASLGPGAAETLLLTASLAECLALDGKRDEAAALLRTVIARGLPRRDFFRDRDLARIIAMVPAATAPADAKAEPAPSLWDDFVSLRATQFGDGHPVAAIARLLAGGSTLAAGDAAQALRHLRPAATALETKLGADHPDVAGALLLLGIAERDAGDRDAAEKVLERALLAWDRIAGPDHEATIAAQHALAMLKVAANRADEALPLLERLRSTYEKSGAGDEWRHVEVLVPLATAYLKKSDKNRAIAAATAAANLDCWQPQRGAADLERRALMLADIAGILRRAGDESESAEAQRRARGLATRLDNPRPVLTEIDRRATAPN